MKKGSPKSGTPTIEELSRCPEKCSYQDVTWYMDIGSRTPSMARRPGGVADAMNRVLRHVSRAAWLVVVLPLTGLRPMRGGGGNPPASPVITTQPVETSAVPGTAATRAVAAACTGLGYEWQGSSDGATWAPLAGATDSSYTIAVTIAADGGRHCRVFVSASCTSVINSAVRLTVTPAVVAPVIDGPLDPERPDVDEAVARDRCRRHQRHLLHGPRTPVCATFGRGKVGSDDIGRSPAALVPMWCVLPTGRARRHRLSERTLCRGLSPHLVSMCRALQLKRHLRFPQSLHDTT